MKKIFSVAFMACVALSATAELQNDTLVVSTTPQMHCAGCENKIKSNIRFVRGTKSIHTSVPNQRVTIVFDDKKAKLEDYVAAFKKIGFDIKVVNH